MLLPSPSTPSNGHVEVRPSPFDFLINVLTIDRVQRTKQKRRQKRSQMTLSRCGPCRRPRFLVTADNTLSLTRSLVSLVTSLWLPCCCAFPSTTPTSVSVDYRRGTSQPFFSFLFLQVLACLMLQCIKHEMGTWVGLDKVTSQGPG